jgi:hypothetical protein
MSDATTTLLLAVSTCLTVMVLWETAAGEEVARIRLVLKALACHSGN